MPRIKPSVLKDYNRYLFLSAMRQNKRAKDMNAHLMICDVNRNNNVGITEESFTCYRDIDDEWKLLFKDLGYSFPKMVDFQAYILDKYSNNIYNK